MGSKCFKLKKITYQEKKEYNEYKQIKQNKSKSVVAKDDLENSMINNNHKYNIESKKNSLLIKTINQDKKSDKKSHSINQINQNESLNILEDIELSISRYYDGDNQLNHVNQVNMKKDNNYLAELFTKNNISFFNTNVEKIEDCYSMIRKLGNGAFGKCFLAELKKGCKDLRFAVKTIPLENIDKEKLILLKTEISCLKKLIHPNIVHFFQLFYDENNIHMVMEPCMNGSLFDKILEKGTFSEKETIKIMIALLSSLNYCHQNKIIHRDIKPENILLVNPTVLSSNKENKLVYEYDLRIIDFGLSHIYNRKETNSLLSSSVGSPYFMAPEVLNERYNSKCDVWSLGILFYFLISGIPPFYSDSIPELFKLILNSEPSFKHESWKNISKQTKDTIKAMLIKDFNKRPSCDELLKHDCFKKEIAKLHGKGLLEHETVLNSIYIYFTKKNNFLKEICSAMSNQLSINDFNKASIFFKQIDKDCNGIVDITPLLGYFKDKQIDISPLKHIPHITYSDILEALTYRKLNKEDFMKFCFETFDVDSDKLISKQDFSISIYKNANKMTQMELDFILNDAGLDNNFRLDFKQFSDKILK